MYFQNVQMTGKLRTPDLELNIITNIMMVLQTFLLYIRYNFLYPYTLISIHRK